MTMIADRDIPDNLFNLDSLNESLLEEINELLDFLIENSDDITAHDRFEYENVDYVENKSLVCNYKKYN